MELEQSKQECFQNLMDAGCDEETAREFTLLLKENKIPQLMHGLAIYRARLLEKIHSNQYQLDCLDFFTYQIRKSEIKK